MIRFFLLLFFQSFVTLTYSTCPKGTLPSMSDNTTCYLFVSQKQRFLIAEEYCNQQNGHLTSIHDAFDNTLIREQAQNNFTDSTSADFWIGLTDLKTPGTWEWMDGTALNFVDWDKGQPNNTFGYDCGAVKLVGGTWISDDCDKEKSFVCIIKTTTTPSSPTKTCPESWVYYDFTGFCYLVVNMTSVWENAEDWCHSKGAHLASIHSFNENSFVTNLIPFDPNNQGCNTGQWVFIGLFSVTNNTWRWTDDSPFDFSAWAPGRPLYSPIINCGIIWNGPRCNAPFETWADDYCYERNQHFVCKTLPN